MEYVKKKTDGRGRRDQNEQETDDKRRRRER